MPEEIGSLVIKLELDREDFNNDLQALETLQSPSLAIATKLDKDSLGRQLQSFQGEVPVGLRLDKGQFEQQLREFGAQSGLEIVVGLRLDDAGVVEQAKQLTGQLEQQFGQVKLHLKPTVDDSALTKLNQHLDLKQRHFAQVRRDFRNPIKPAIDTSELDAASSQFQALKEQIANLQNQAASVRFTADTSEVDAQINRLQGKTIRLKSNVEGGEDSATETADVFAKAIAKAIKKSNSKGIFGGLFEGIGAIASAPFKIVGATISNVFTGVGLGVGEQISKDLGKGLFAGIEDELSPLIGSFKLLGREAGSALTKEILNALGEDGVLIQKILGDLIGQEKILTESGASQSRSKKERNQNRVEATRFFAEERRENDVVAISKERKKLFVEQPAQIEELEGALGRKVDRGVRNLDSNRIKKIDQGQLDEQSALTQKLLETENRKLAQLQTRLAEQRQAIAAAEQKVAELGRVDNKSPEFQAAKADLRTQKAGFAQTKRQELAATSNVSNFQEKLSELADQPKPIQTQIKNAAKRSSAESKRLEALQKSLSKQGQAIAAAEQKVAKLQQVGDNSPELSKAEADLAIKKQRFAETQQNASTVASSVERYANKLTDLSDKLNSLQEIAAKSFQDEFEQLERLKEQVSVNQRAFAKKGQILESAKVLGTIQAPETIDSEIAQKRARVEDLQGKRAKIAATSKSDGEKIREVQKLKAEDLVQARTGGAPLAAPDSTPEQVKGGRLEARPVQQQADRAIQKLQVGQIQRQGLYRNLTKEIEQEEQQLRSLAAQKSDPLAKKSQADVLRQTLVELIRIEKDAARDAQAALQSGDDALTRQLLARKKAAIEKQALVRNELAFLGEEVNGATQSVQSAPSPRPSGAPAPATPKTTQAPKAATPTPAPAATPTNDLYTQALQRTAQELTGKSLSADQIPQLRSSAEIRGKAQYNAGVNAISLKPELFDVLSAPLTKESIAPTETALAAIVHEATHGTQFNFGKTNPFDGDANPVQGLLDPTPEEIKTFGSRIEGSTNKGVAEDPQVVGRRRELETQAYLAEGRIGKPIAQDLIKQKAIAQFQQTGGVGGDKLRGGLAQLLGDLNKVAAEAAKAGVDVSADQQAIIQKIATLRNQLAPLIQQSQSLEILPTEEILDLQEAFEKSVGTLVPVAGDIQRLKEKVAGKATQAGIAQPAQIKPTAGQQAASTFKNQLGLGAGKLRRGLEEVQVEVNGSLEEIAELAGGLGIDASQEIRDAIANIEKAKAELEPLFDKAARIDILPAEEIAALQEQIQAKTQAALDLIGQQPSIVGQQLDAKVGDGPGEPIPQEAPKATAEPQPVAIPQAQPQPLAIPLPELKAEAKGELVQVQAAPIAKTKTAGEVARQLGTQAGKTFKAAADAGSAIADKAKQTAQVVANTGQQVFNVVRQINPDEALEQAKNIASSFGGTYKELKDALTAQKKALKKGDFSAAQDLGRKAQGLAKTVLDLADKAQQDIAGLTSSLGDAAAFGTDLGSKLANKKAQISRVRNEVGRVQKVGKLDDTAGAIDVPATSSPPEDDGLAAFGDFQKLIEEQKQNLLAKLKDEAFLTDLAVNTGGFVGGKIGSKFGPVGEAGGDLIGALATRQAITVGKAGSAAFNNVKDTDEFKEAGKFQKLILLTRQLKKELQSPEIQKALGGELTGDIAGFVVGNIASKLGGAGLQALGGAVPGAQLLSMVPQGAIAASLAVPKIVEARERFASQGESASDEGPELAAVADLGLVIEKQKQRLAKLLKLSGESPNLNTSEIQAKLQELDREIDQRVGDRLDLLEVEVALGNSAPASIPEPQAREVESSELTDRRIRKQKAIALNPEQQQKFAALEIEAERDLNESLPPESLGKAARFDADAERIENRINRTFEQGTKQDPLNSKPATAGDRLKATAGKELGEYGKALQQGVGQFGVDLSKLPGFAQGIFAKLAEGPEFLNNSFKGLLGNVGNLVKGFLAFQGLSFAQGILSNFAQGALDAALKLDSLKTALNFASGGSTAGAANLDFVRQTVDDLKVPLGAAQQGFKQLSAATRNTSVEGQATRDLFVGISQAATVLGLSTEESSGSLLALSQIASKGKVQAEELRGQLGERIPGAFGIAARAMGVTEGELNKLLETGQVTSEEFLPKFAKQLQSEFGGAAVSASKNAQSAIFDFENSVLKLSESFGKAVQPAQVAGLRAGGVAMKFLAERGTELAQAVGLVATIVGTRLLVSLAPAALALIKTAFASKVAAAGMKAFGLTSIQAFGAFAAQIAIAAALAETLRTVFSNFTPSDLGNQFKDFGDQAVENLKRVRIAAGEIRQETDKIKAPTEGFDLTLGLGGLTGLGAIKTDSLVTAFREKVPGAQQLKGFVENATGGRISPFTTVGESKFNRDQVEANESVLAAQGLIGRGLDSGSIAGQLSNIQNIDTQLKQNQVDRKRAAGALKPDKNELKRLDDEKAKLLKERESAGSELNGLRNGLNSNLSGAKAQIAAIDAKGLDPELAKQLKQPYENTVALTEKALKNLDRLESKTKVAVDPARALASAFLKVQTTLEESERTAERTFRVRSLAIAQKKNAGFSTDINAGRNAAVEQAKEEQTRAAAVVEREQTAFDTRKAELEKPEAKAALGEISLNNKPITVNSSIAEIDAAKKTLTDR
ncbi:tape measure protein [Trichocoleus desertorum AS-A10]|uniref:tape measure protein n=1 Tax=Trichocoleus desertorum TaxID=1481672 RepID=UPI0032973864